ASDQPPLCDGRCGVSLPRRFPVGWPLFMWKVGHSIHMTSSSIPPLVLSFIQWLALVPLVFLCMQVQMQPLDNQPNIERTHRQPIGGAYEAFRSYFHFGHVSKCLGVYW